MRGQQKGGGFINAERQLEAYIDQYQNLIFSICYKYTENYFDAEDLTQETFLSAYKAISLFDGQSAKAWLCKMPPTSALTGPSGPDAALSQQRRNSLQNFRLLAPLEEKIIWKKVQERLYS